jgi:hypothetical protein
MAAGHRTAAPRSGTVNAGSCSPISFVGSAQGFLASKTQISAATVATATRLKVPAWQCDGTIRALY